ncbi:hypothetical protein [Paludisphaera mucosa]|uniref:Uncharacterized protein n=1 Tax=Paludisphaera mucosa TaxID=3030827 RepID=A0ABT6FAQ0_9BACT|nr:hypothetical protein [Paludisphaera mucosa]MDG3004666.1 hypothetical protein [Paludisphaera mucosa]
MRATIRNLSVALAIATLSGCTAVGSRCLHRPCTSECAASFDSPAPFAVTSMTGRPSLISRVRSRLWDRDETPRDVTVRPETTPIPGATVARRSPAASGVLDLPPVTAEAARED